MVEGAQCPELWEINVYCLNHSIFCYDNLNWLRQISISSSRMKFRCLAVVCTVLGFAPEFLHCMTHRTCSVNICLKNKWIKSTICFESLKVDDEWVNKATKYGKRVFLDHMSSMNLGFPSGSVVRNRLPMQEMQRCGFDPWVGKISWNRKWQPIPVFLPGKSHGQRSLVGISPWDCKQLYTSEHAHTHVSL